MLGPDYVSAFTGSAATPGVKVGDAGGFYAYGVGQLGYSVKGIHAGYKRWQTLHFTDDSLIEQSGREMTHTGDGGEVYPVVRSVAKQTFTGNRGGFGAALYGTEWTWRGVSHVTEHVGADEDEKFEANTVEVDGVGATLLMDRVWRRSWLPVAKTGVTMAKAFHRTFTIPDTVTAPGSYQYAGAYYYQLADNPGQIVPANGFHAHRFSSGWIAMSSEAGVDLVFKPGRTVVLSGLPTSASGLPTGGLYNDGGVVKVSA